MGVLRKLKTALYRCRHHEFWPGWLYYLPLLPWCTWLGLRHGGLMSFTCANPAIPCGGGMVGESKYDILTALAPVGDALLAAILLEPDAPEARLAALKTAMCDGRLPAEYPIVLKPDIGQRGYGVRIVHNEEEAKAYLGRMHRPVIAQTYHPGPIEVGLSWIRTLPQESTNAQENSLGNAQRLSDAQKDARSTFQGDDRSLAQGGSYSLPQGDACSLPQGGECSLAQGVECSLAQGGGLSSPHPLPNAHADSPPPPLGRIFSLTIKHFPEIQGDGVHTLKHLITQHPRYRCQASILLARLGDRQHDIPRAGERISLGSIGNHSQGAIFRDATEYVTPALEAWVDRVVSAFCPTTPAAVPLSPGDNGLDFCRLDIRVRTLDDLRAARHLAIIELNGSAAESTNIYDPDRSLAWSWRILLAQWATLYRLGSYRRAQGVRPMGLLALRRAWRTFDQDRPPLFVAE